MMMFIEDAHYNAPRILHDTKASVQRPENVYNTVNPVTMHLIQIDHALVAVQTFTSLTIL